MRRVGIVTGAARGIGAAVVRELAESGWAVVAVDACADDPGVGYPLADVEQLEQLAAAHSGSVVPVVADVRDPLAMRDAVAVAEDSFGALHAAVAAAAVITGGKPLWETTAEEWETLFAVGVHGVANLARAAVPALLRQRPPRSGRFVALASAAGHRGLSHLSGYVAAKHAVVGLVRALAHDLRDTGVTATAVSPGSTDTAMLAGSAQIYGLSSVDDFAQHQLVQRILSPEEVAAAVCWLCSRHSSAVTGTVVHADGGFTA